MIKQKLFQNFGHPTGLFGRLAGQIMAHKKSNTERGRWAVAELDPEPGARVLEVGYGPGVALQAMSQRLPEGELVGVDISELMYAQASRRNSAAIERGTVSLRIGDAQALAADLADFDLIYGMNVWQFWVDPVATIAALRERLADGGRLALLYMQPPTATTTSHEGSELLQQQFAAAGFEEIEVRTMKHEPPAVLVIGS